MSDSTKPLDLSGQIGRVSAPVREQVLDVLREAILSFRLTPGQRLIERELMVSTGVSRTTIREVLRELAAEGLVATVPQKGAIVVRPTEHEATELYELRGVLEGHVVKRFVENATDARIAALRRAFTQLETAVGRGAETLVLLKAKDHMYDLLAEGAGNNELRAAVARLHARVSLLRATSLTSSDARPSEMLAEMRDLVEAVERRDSAAAQRAGLRHVERAAAAGIAGLTTAGFPPH